MPSKRGTEQLKAASKSGANKKGKAGLSDKAKAFVDEYLKNPVATQAAIAAGYSPRYAKQKGSELLKDPRIKAKVEEFQAERRKDTILSFDERARILSEIARGNLAEFIDTEKGIVRIDTSGDAMTGAALAQVDQRAEYDREGGLKGYTTKVKLRDPISAIKELNTMYGDHAPTRIRAEITGTIDAMTQAEAEAELERLEKESTEVEGSQGEAE